MSKTTRTTREQMINRVRAALDARGQGGEPGPPPRVDDSTARHTRADEPLADLFVERAEALGMSVTRCTASSLNATVGDRLSELEAERIVISVGGIDEASTLEASLVERGVKVAPWRGDPEMKAAFEAEVGVTGVKAAIAESGSLIYASGADYGRGLMLAPPVHLAILRASEVIADLLDHVRNLDATEPAALPAGEVVISGPSKTADIEGVLITGVHGPGKLLVVLVDDA